VIAYFDIKYIFAMKRGLVLVKDDAHNRDKWRCLTTGNRPNNEVMRV